MPWPHPTLQGLGAKAVRASLDANACFRNAEHVKAVEKYSAALQLLRMAGHGGSRAVTHCLLNPL